MSLRTTRGVITKILSLLLWLKKSFRFVRWHLLHDRIIPSTFWQSQCLPWKADEWIKTFLQRDRLLNGSKLHGHKGLFLKFFSRALGTGQDYFSARKFSVAMGRADQKVAMKTDKREFSIWQIFRKIKSMCLRSSTSSLNLGLSCPWPLKGQIEVSGFCLHSWKVLMVFMFPMIHLWYLWSTLKSRLCWFNRLLKT